MKYLQHAFPADFTGTQETSNIFYTDVSGDGQEDLIVDGFLEVIVLVWSGSNYLQPFRIHYPYWKYDPGSTVWLEDWTRDGTPEVIFDYRGDTGGTGIAISWWRRHVIHCKETGCQVAWESEFGSETHDNNLGGISIGRVDTTLLANPNGVPMVRRFSERFSVYCCWLLEDPSEQFPFANLNIYTSTVSEYLWTGSVFTVTREQIASLPTTTGVNSVLVTISSTGISASITASSNNGASELNDRCQLVIAEQTIGQVFGCKRNFTLLKWRDITGDGREDLTIVALSGAYDSSLSNKPLSEKGCVHQRFLAYDISTPTPREVANLTGCLVQSDLFGVKLEDYDRDGQTEIIAAKTPFTEEICRSNLIGGCWYQLMGAPAIEIYKWNGSQFVFWDDVPGQP